MKNSNLLFQFEEEAVAILHKGTQLTPFKTTKKLHFIDRAFFASDRLNVIETSADIFYNFQYEKLLLINPNTGKHINVSLSLSNTTEECTFAATPHLKEVLGLHDGEECYLCSYKNLVFHEVRLQKIDNIREKNLVLSEFDYNNLLCEVKSSPYKFFEVYNTFSHDSIIVQKSHIITDKTLAPGTIRLNRKQRICLGKELPPYLSKNEWLKLEEKLGKEHISLQILNEVYSCNNYTLNPLAAYDKKLQAKKILTECFPSQLHIIPVPESLCCKRKGLLRRLCDFYVGKSTLSLIGRRPYDIDEGLDVVRMTKSNMNLLGIDEMDKVVLQYKNKRFSCRVLEFDNEEAFQQTNLPISQDLVVGIPAHIRKKLGLCDLSSSLKIDRDTSFIFKKNINEQVIPILLTLFSTNVFTDSSIIWSAVFSIIAIPIVLYFNLSSKRNMRA